jgi:hypothetical protein
LVIRGEVGIALALSTEAKALLAGVPNIEEIFCPGKRNSVAMVRFTTSQNMWDWTKVMRGKKLKHHTVQGNKDMWWSVEKNPGSWRRDFRHHQSPTRLRIQGSGWRCKGAAPTTHT